MHRLDTFTDGRRAARQHLRARFERILRRRTGLVTLDRLPARLRGRKAELLRVLDRPEIPLHTNGSENDIRFHLRGIANLASEWKLIAPARNCRRLHRLRAARPHPKTAAYKGRRRKSDGLLGWAASARNRPCP